MLKKFTINKLYGTTSVSIPFDESGTNIFVGENGLGKTTVLNILYFFLMKRFRKLTQYNFASIEIEFNNKEVLILKYKDLEALNNTQDNRNIPSSLIQTIIDEIPEPILQSLINEIQSRPMSRDEILGHPAIQNLTVMRRYPTRILYDAILSFVDEDLSENLKKLKDSINKNLEGVGILYLPTYRRIEEDLKNLNLSVESDDYIQKNTNEKLIQFGMNDVVQRFKIMQDTIQKLSSQGLAKISSEILSQLITGAPEINDTQLKNMNAENIQIILARVGPALSNTDKKLILEKLESSKLKEEDRFLVYFVQKLIDIYENQKKFDDRIKKYIKVCNRYFSFSKKELIYNENEVEFYLTSTFFPERKLLLKFLGKLSSGEKQIVSLFSKLYLSLKEQKYIVLFDEPELSLSIDWQELLLPDIIESGNCANLIAVTHSPFIFDNNLKNYARGLSEFIKKDF